MGLALCSAPLPRGSRPIAPPLCRGGSGDGCARARRPGGGRPGTGAEESRECHVPGWTCKYSSDAERRLCLTLARSVGHLLTGETVVQVRMLVASVCEL